MDYDWSKFDIYFYIEASPDDVYQRWVCASGLESFFVQRAHFVDAMGIEREPNEPFKEGDTYSWTWWDNSVSSGKIIGVDESKRSLPLTFLDCRVSVSVSRNNGAALIHLMQSKIPLTEYDKVRTHLNCRGGWIYFLTILKGVLESGVDVREKDPKRTNCVEVGFHPRGQLISPIT